MVWVYTFLNSLSKKILPMHIFEASRPDSFIYWKEEGHNLSYIRSTKTILIYIDIKMLISNLVNNLHQVCQQFND